MRGIDSLRYVPNIKEIVCPRRGDPRGHDRPFGLQDWVTELFLDMIWPNNVVKLVRTLWVL